MTEKILATQSHLSLLNFLKGRPFLGPIGGLSIGLSLFAMTLILWALGDAALGMPSFSLSKYLSALWATSQAIPAAFQYLHLSVMIPLGIVGVTWVLARRPQTLKLSDGDLVLQIGKRSRRMALDSIMECTISRGALYVRNKDHCFVFGAGLGKQKLQEIKAQIDHAIGEERRYTPSLTVQFASIALYALAFVLIGGATQANLFEVLMFFTVAAAAWFVYRLPALQMGVRITGGASGTINANPLSTEVVFEEPIQTTLGFEEPAGFDRLDINPQKSEKVEVGRKA